MKPAPATPEQAPPERDLTPTGLSGHEIVVGFGRVGHAIADARRSSGLSILAVEENEKAAAAAQAMGVEVIRGNVLENDVLTAANIKGAATLFVAIPDGFEAGGIVERARAMNASLPIIVRAHSDAEQEHVMRLGATATVIGEREIGLAMAALVPAASGTA